MFQFVYLKTNSEFGERIIRNEHHRSKLATAGHNDAVTNTRMMLEHVKK